jgi:hypothetical protein
MDEIHEWAQAHPDEHDKLRFKLFAFEATGNEHNKSKEFW